jgi:hypothetical protein
VISLVRILRHGLKCLGRGTAIVLVGVNRVRGRIKRRCGRDGLQIEPACPDCEICLARSTPLQVGKVVPRDRLALGRKWIRLAGMFLQVDADSRRLTGSQRQDSDVTLFMSRRYYSVNDIEQQQ